MNNLDKRTSSSEEQKNPSSKQQKDEEKDFYENEIKSDKHNDKDCIKDEKNGINNNSNNNDNNYENDRNIDGNNDDICNNMVNSDKIDEIKTKGHQSIEQEEDDDDNDNNNDDENSGNEPSITDNSLQPQNRKRNNSVQTSISSGSATGSATGSGVVGDFGNEGDLEDLINEEFSEIMGQNNESSNDEKEINSKNHRVSSDSDSSMMEVNINEDCSTPKVDNHHIGVLNKGKGSKKKSISIFSKLFSTLSPRKKDSTTKSSSSTPQLGLTEKQKKEDQQQQQLLQEIEGTNSDMKLNYSLEEEALHKQMQKKFLEQAIKGKEQKKSKLDKEDFLHKVITIWEKKLIPTFSLQPPHRDDILIKQLVWKWGLPPKLRGTIWQLSIGNSLRITRELFEILSSKDNILHQDNDKNVQNVPVLDDSSSIASTNLSNSIKNIDSSTTTGEVPNTNVNSKKTIEEKSFTTNDASGQDSAGGTVNRENTINLIQIDLSRTFPSLQIFQPGGPYYDLFKQVLQCYVRYRPDVGYVQGMSYLVAMFLLNMDCLESFTCLANMLNSSHFYSFFRINTQEIDKHIHWIYFLMKEVNPKLYKHFENHNVSMKMFVFDWFMTLFAKSLPLDIATRIWDLYLIESNIPTQFSMSKKKSKSKSSAVPIVISSQSTVNPSDVSMKTNSAFFIYSGDLLLYRVTLGILNYFESKLLKLDFEQIMYFLSHLQQFLQQQNVETIQQAASGQNSVMSPELMLLLSEEINEKKLFECISKIQITSTRLQRARLYVEQKMKEQNNTPL